MAVTATAVVFGTWKSRVQNLTVSTAGATSLDAVTIVHLLPTTPDYVLPVVRSVIATPSSGPVGLVVDSYNASQAIILVNPDAGGAVRANIDVVCGFFHSIEA